MHFLTLNCIFRKIAAKAFSQQGEAYVVFYCLNVAGRFFVHAAERKIADSFIVTTKGCVNEFTSAIVVYYFGGEKRVQIDPYFLID